MMLTSIVTLDVLSKVWFNRDFADKFLQPKTVGLDNIIFAQYVYMYVIYDKQLPVVF